MLSRPIGLLICTPKVRRFWGAFYLQYYLLLLDFAMLVILFSVNVINSTRHFDKIFLLQQNCANILYNNANILCHMTDIIKVESIKGGMGL